MAQTWSVIRGDIETQISGGALSYRVAATNIGAPPKRTITTRGVFQNGQSLYGFRYSKRILSLVFFADAASLALADTMRDDIYELWRGIEGQAVTLKVTRDDGMVRLIDGEIVNVIDFPDAVGDRYGASQRFSVQLECHNPFWREQSLVVKNVAVNGSIIITYDGQFPTEPIINIIGPITNPVLTQAATGKKLDFTGTTIAAGDNYRIDTRYGYKTVLDSTLTNRVANLTSDSNLADFTHGNFNVAQGMNRWTALAATELNDWWDVKYGNGVWVAVAGTGTNRIMRSTNGGVTWSAVAAPEANEWQSVTYGNGVWVAVAITGTNRVMRSTNDGVSWSAVAAAEANAWQSVAYGNGVWVAVAYSGTNRVMRSTNGGVTWSAVAATEANNWRSVAYGNGVWVAVSGSGTNRVMRSTDDGVTWSAIMVSAGNWAEVMYGNGVWIIVGESLSTVERSTDNGATWTTISIPKAERWYAVAYGNGVWVSVAWSGERAIMYSTDDGLTWNLVQDPEGNYWIAISYGDAAWVATAFSGTKRVMRSDDFQSYSLRGTGTTSTTAATMTYNNLFLGI